MNGCGSDSLDLDDPLDRIESAIQRDMGSGEGPNSLRVLDDPDCLIVVGDKNSALGFPFWMAHRSTSTPTFLDAIGASWFGVLDPTSLIADPARKRR